MIDLQTFARQMLENGKAVSQEVAQKNGDFCPMLIAYRDDAILPLPLPNYTKDRECHQIVMRAMLKAVQADGFVFVMEAWFSEYKMDKAPDPNAPGFVPPSRDPKRQEMLVVHGMSRAGGQAGYCCKIKRHGHKLVFGEVENLMDTAHGKSMVAMMGAMFGEKAN
jgi:hypothetical protein